MQCCAVLVQDVTSLYPCVRVTTGEGGLFGGQCAYEGNLDRQPVFTSNSLSNAVISTFALYHVFAVHYPKKLLKTCTFLSSQKSRYQLSRPSSTVLHVESTCNTIEVTHFWGQSLSASLFTVKFRLFVTAFLRIMCWLSKDKCMSNICSHLLGWLVITRFYSLLCFFVALGVVLCPC